MSVRRINYGDTRVYVNNILLTGISDCAIDTERSYEDLRSFGRYDVVNRIVKSDQVPKVNISWILGEGSSDPFFDHQNSGLISVEKFDIKKRDIVGENIVSGAFITSYSVNASVGDIVTAQAQYEGSTYSFSDTGALDRGIQTNDSGRSFIPSKITVSSNFGEGQVAPFPIQSFQISVSIPRSPFKTIGSLVPQYRIPNLPVEASISFSVIKNEITGMNFAPIILEKGSFEFEMKSCANIGKKYTVDNCSLASISESINLDGNATVDFSYISSLNNQGFVYADSL
jgi:hypothetical protein